VNTLFTLGHSSHPILRVVELLRQHGVTAVCDVRSKPYSRRNPQFNREAFAKSLAEAGIAYVFLGKELGGRPEDPACYVDGRVDYERMARTALFEEGMRRLAEDAGRYRVALVCAEKDPADCHRAMLVGREAHGRGWTVNHILADGGVATQNDVVGGLLA
jgi:uncharacterized protein (DUF488 family)